MSADMMHLRQSDLYERVEGISALPDLIEPSAVPDNLHLTRVLAYEQFVARLG